jgi:hypothetical protein
MQVLRNLILTDSLGEKLPDFIGFSLEPWLAGRESYLSSLQGRAPRGHARATRPVQTQRFAEHRKMRSLNAT